MKSCPIRCASVSVANVALTQASVRGGGGVALFGVGEAGGAEATVTDDGVGRDVDDELGDGVAVQPPTVAISNRAARQAGAARWMAGMRLLADRIQRRVVAKPAGTEAGAPRAASAASPAGADGLCRRALTPH